MNLRKLSNRQINKLLDKLDVEWSTCLNELIEAGRGYETSNEIQKKMDPLSLKYKLLVSKYSNIRFEMERRWGINPPYRLPIKRRK